MAIVIATRIQDDFSSNRPHLLCVGTARRAVAGGLRTDGSIFRADPPPWPLPHTQKKGNQPTATPPTGPRPPSQFLQSFADKRPHIPTRAAHLSACQFGIGNGFTLPQSALLKTDVDVLVHSTAFAADPGGGLMTK